MKLASRFGRINQIRRDRPLAHEELVHRVPGVFGNDKHESCSDRSGKATMLCCGLPHEPFYSPFSQALPVHQ